jgi:hypothetical protein
MHGTGISKPEQILLDGLGGGGSKKGWHSTPHTHKHSLCAVSSAGSEYSLQRKEKDQKWKKQARIKNK